VSLTEANAVRNYTTGLDTAVAFENFLPLDSVQTHDSFLVLNASSAPHDDTDSAGVGAGAGAGAGAAAAFANDDGDGSGGVVTNAVVLRPGKVLPSTFVVEATFWMAPSLATGAISAAMEASAGILVGAAGANGTAKGLYVGIAQSTNQIIVERCVTLVMLSAVSMFLDLCPRLYLPALRRIGKHLCVPSIQTQ
jgi:hypothetical protein